MADGPSGIDRNADEKMEFSTSKEVTVHPTFESMSLKGMFGSDMPDLGTANETVQKIFFVASMPTVTSRPPLFSRELSCRSARVATPLPRRSRVLVRLRPSRSVCSK